LLASAGPMTWRAHLDRWRVVEGGDVAPTSLNEGRGEVVVPTLVFMFHLGLNLEAEVWWMDGAVVVVRAKG